MKKIFLMLLGAMMVCGVKAQTPEEGEPVMVYYSPKTSIVLDFTYTEQTETAGELAEFAEELLGISNAVTESKTTYTFKGVTIATRTAADLERPHMIKAEKGMPWQLLNINDKGLLVGYNMTPDAPKQAKSSTKEAERSRISPIRVLPYTEEILTAKSEEEKAQAVAKQILHLRETRMYLLSGEVEHAPADGKAMQLVLEELDKQERELTELFVGKRSVQTEHKLVLWEKIRKSSFRESTIQKNLLYFSEENGFTNKENVDADSITILIGRREQTYQVANLDQKASKKGEALSQIAYNLPGNALVQVSYKGRMIAERTIPVAQLGIDVPLPQSLFTGKVLPKIRFDEKTGNLVRISK
jgi:hypothetical protein